MIVAFDVYGTLINTEGVLVQLTAMIGDDAPAFSRLWRDRQLEYSFRRGLMQHYENFAVCTRDALTYTNTFFNAPLSQSQQQTLLEAYRTLPAFIDVGPALAHLSAQGASLFAFSNGTAEAVEGLLTHAGIRAHFDGIVSVDALKSFKPNPAVYAHLLRATGATHDQAWLVSSNSFDIIGAVSAGLRAAWVQRSDDAIFDPWGVEPTVTVKTLQALAEVI